jgi:hypothetical protein
MVSPQVGLKRHARGCLNPPTGCDVDQHRPLNVAACVLEKHLPAPINVTAEPPAKLANREDLPADHLVTLRASLTPWPRARGLPPVLLGHSGYGAVPEVVP